MSVNMCRKQKSENIFFDYVKIQNVSPKLLKILSKSKIMINKKISKIKYDIKQRACWFRFRLRVPTNTQHP